MLWRYSNDLGKWRSVDLHNSASGLTAVIVCNGPSLNKTNLASLHGPGRVVIGVNNSYPMVRPDIWMGMDLPRHYDPRLWWEPFTKILRSGLHDTDECRSIRSTPAAHFLDFRKNLGRESVFDAMSGLAPSWENDTFTAAVHFALYLGCRKILFVGVDFDNSKEDYANGQILTEEKRLKSAQLYTEQEAWLRWFAIEAPKRGILCFASPEAGVKRFLPVADAMAFAH